MADVTAVAEAFVICLAAYFSIGVLVAVLFLTFGVSRIDAAAKRASPFFRPVIFLGCVALWPFVILRVASLKKINLSTEDLPTEETK